jgi:hypothetical protein
MAERFTSDVEKEHLGYLAGIEAAKVGEPDINPYYQNTPEWRGWERGYRAEKAKA